jgi:hypothetical protein
MLCGCERTNNGYEQALSYRKALVDSNGYTFNAVITADYQNVFYTFSLQCQADAMGNVNFTVLAPDTISGITGVVTENDGKLTFDDRALLFPTLPEAQITPVCAPWLFINALCSGYITGTSVEEDGIYLLISDNYAEQTIQVNIQFIDQAPGYVEIICKNRRVISMSVEEFCIL